MAHSNFFIKRSCEDRNRVYLELFGRRFVFQNGKYHGFYKP